MHLGHEWLIRQKLDKGIPVLVMIRDCPADEANPLDAAEVQGMFQQRYNGLVQTMIIPDIESVNYGRGVGYEVNEFKPPLDIKAISGTDLRAKISMGSNWRDYIDPSLWTGVEEIYGG